MSTPPQRVKPVIVEDTPAQAPPPPGYVPAPTQQYYQPPQPPYYSQPYYPPSPYPAAPVTIQMPQPQQRAIAPYRPPPPPSDINKIVSELETYMTAMNKLKEFGKAMNPPDTIGAVLNSQFGAGIGNGLGMMMNQFAEDQIWRKKMRDFPNFQQQQPGAPAQAPGMDANALQQAIMQTLAPLVAELRETKDKVDFLYGQLQQNINQDMGMPAAPGPQPGQPTDRLARMEQAIARPAPAPPAPAAPPAPTPVPPPQAQATAPPPTPPPAQAAASPTDEWANKNMLRVGAYAGLHQIVQAMKRLSDAKFPEEFTRTFDISIDPATKKVLPMYRPAVLGLVMYDMIGADRLIQAEEACWSQELDDWSKANLGCSAKETIDYLKSERGKKMLVKGLKKVAEKIKEYGIELTYEEKQKAAAGLQEMYPKHDLMDVVK